jgi:hypothetical protein
VHERAETGLKYQIVLGCGHEHADAAHVGLGSFASILPIPPGHLIGRVHERVNSCGGGVRVATLRTAGFGGHSGENAGGTARADAQRTTTKPTLIRVERKLCELMAEQ